jgi:hypothetical protein
MQKFQHFETPDEYQSSLKKMQEKRHLEFLGKKVPQNLGYQAKMKIFDKKDGF